jgi:glycine/serine hydroxymethyltransferase
MKEAEMEQIGGLIARVLESIEDEAVIAEARKAAADLAARFPLYE